jgi:energy-converting hydrogenase Eha subunit A
MYLVPVVGRHRAGQIGFFIGSALVLGIAWLTRRWRHGASTRVLFAIGVLWAALTVAFEFLFGYYAFGYSISYIAGDFNLFAGHLMLLGVLVMLFAPILVARLSARAG